DPRYTRLFYDEENPRVKLYAVKTFVQGGCQRVNLYYPDRIEKWVTAPGVKPGKAKPKDWDQYDDGSGTWPLENPYGQIPVFHFRTERPYGEPVHIDSYGAQNSLDKLTISQMAAVDYFATPARYALMGTDLEDGQDDATDFGFLQTDQDEDLTPGFVEDRSQIKANPGEIATFRGAKSVGQFEPGSADNFLKPLGFTVRALAQLTGTPTHQLDMQGDSPSGDALRVSEAPLVKRVRALQLTFGVTWREAFAFMLLLLDQEDAPNIS